MMSTRLPSNTNTGGPATSDKQLSQSQVSGRRPPLPPLRPLHRTSPSSTAPSTSAMYTVPSSHHVLLPSTTYPIQNTAGIPISNRAVSAVPPVSIEPRATAEISQPLHTQLPNGSLLRPIVTMDPPIYNVNSGSSSSHGSPGSNQRSSPLLSHYSVISSAENSHHGNALSMPDDITRPTPYVYPSAYPPQMLAVSTTENNPTSSFPQITTAVQATSLPISSNVIPNGYSVSSPDEERLDRIREARFRGPSSTQAVQQSSISNIPVSTYEQQGRQPLRPAVTIGQEASMQQSGMAYLGPSSVDQRQHVNTQMPPSGVVNVNGTTHLPSNVSNTIPHLENYPNSNGQIPPYSGSIVPHSILQHTPPRSPTSLGVGSALRESNGICTTQYNGLNGTVGKKRNRPGGNGRKTKPEDSDKIIKEALQDFANAGMDGERGNFLSEYSDLLECFEKQSKCIDKAVEETCQALVLDCKIPYLDDQALCQIEDETKDDANDKLLVKKKFVEAMEVLQREQQPSKRRGNLPKESTAYLKKWFKDHSENPCKFVVVVSNYEMNCLSLLSN